MSTYKLYKKEGKLKEHREVKTHAGVPYSNNLSSLKEYIIIESDWKEYPEGAEVNEFVLSLQVLSNGNWVDRIDGDVIEWQSEKNKKQKYRTIVRPKKQTICGCGQCSTEYQHASDCAVHNEPAMPNGECDCRPAKPAKDKIEDETVDWKVRCLAAEDLLEDLLEYLKFRKRNYKYSVWQKAKNIE